jgi:3-methyladenine DNA glycosylase AlkC
MRKGSKSIATIDKKILKQLNAGEIPTANLVEVLGLDCDVLAKTVGIKSEKCMETSIVKKMQFFGSKIKDWEKYKDHISDTVRGFACYSLAQSEMNFKDKLEAIKYFADDNHFGVREWAWLSVRNEISENVSKSIQILEKWSNSKSENIRRFSSEAIRPRGVWCSHIQDLKTNPELGLCILENLKSDDSKYVKDSVGNWLNDASKTQPLWVKKICADWKKVKNVNTDYIIKKALRSI